MNSKFNALFETFKLPSGVELGNRIVMAPMTNYSSHEDGTVSDAEIAYYERRSNGAGLVITACTYVTPNGKGFPGEFAGDRDEMIPSLARLASAIKGQGAKAILQIFHGGRSCPPELVPNGETVSASAVSEEKAGSVVPRALTDAEIKDIIRDFGETTRRAIEAGYDGVEIHGANGYLIQQFFSPHSNRRDDRWGGDVNKRMTFPLAIVDEVQRVVAEHAKQPFAVGYRFSPEEPETPGISMDDSIQLVNTLADKGLDYIHVSLMDFWSAPRTQDDNRPRIEIILETVGGRTPVMGVGSIHTADDALKALETGVPLIALGRELIVEPDWVGKVADGHESEIKTTLTKEDQERLVIPDPLWNAIINTPGWFPVV
ncbi:NADH-dependent flavin oxidoreductase [Paenibacillus sp. UNC499MF]|uniref:NADH-dependent flavin oxidoreductase n=1 Tax=Paenibacillus sp. UNC499MF TaxID=1502751 RepID=UPI00089FC89B|nr:NADH-dependent flavin oxidoreductase [Paenibacillus sp. UNC499MF]SEG64465.1 2,4-dienoyl-CoA reductase [Paenibacillus sp. UNC499MF]